MRYIVSVWKGDESLLVTYWLFYVGGALCFALAGHLILTFYGQLNPPQYAWFLATLSIYTLFCIGAVWRSSGAYKGTAWWKYLSRLSMALATIALLGKWAEFSEIQVVNISAPSLSKEANTNKNYGELADKCRRGELDKETDAFCKWYSSLPNSNQEKELIPADGVKKRTSDLWHSFLLKNRNQDWVEVVKSPTHGDRACADFPEFFNKDRDENNKLYSISREALSRLTEDEMTLIDTVADSFISFLNVHDFRGLNKFDYLFAKEREKPNLWKYEDLEVLKHGDVAPCRGIGPRGLYRKNRYKRVIK